MTYPRNIVVGGDHAGFPYKDAIINHLTHKGYVVLDVGTNSTVSVDYPDFAHAAADAVESGRADLGVLLCGSANGVSITANKHQSVRCALCWREDVAALARQHNDANIVAIPARFVSLESALDIIDAFLLAQFEGGRHATRVGKIACR
ncbi:MAG: ribose 5-phosphate isomerase B [Saprospiraceae bacterium]|nr:ribose 5-phosphate isomerase B [Saprospiraceae bacterium]